MEQAIARVLGKYDENISALALVLRGYLLAQLSNIKEYPDVPANVIGYGYGPGYKDQICVIIPSKKGIKLGFNRGSELPDPAGLLTGSGKVHRYVVINSEKEIKSAALKKLLAEGVKAWMRRTEGNTKSKKK